MCLNRTVSEAAYAHLRGVIPPLLGYIAGFLLRKEEGASPASEGDASLDRNFFEDIYVLLCTVSDRFATTLSTEARVSASTLPDSIAQFYTFSRSEAIGVATMMREMASHLQHNELYLSPFFYRWTHR